MKTISKKIILNLSGIKYNKNCHVK